MTNIISPTYVIDLEQQVRDLRAACAAKDRTIEMWRGDATRADVLLKALSTLGIRFIAVAGKNDDSPAYISEPQSFADAYADPFCQGYPYVHIEVAKA